MQKEEISKLAFLFWKRNKYVRNLLSKNILIEHPTSPFLIFRYCKSLMLIANWKMSANHVFYQLDQPIIYYLLFDSLTWHLQWNDVLFWLSLMVLILKRRNYKLKNKFLFIANKVEKTLKYLCFVVLSVVLKELVA